METKLNPSTNLPLTKFFTSHTDHLSGSNIVTTESGAIAQTLDYYPFGSIRIDQKAADQGTLGTGTTFNTQKKFTGHFHDPDTNLTYMGARYYDSDIGRLTQEDPVFIDFDFSSVNTGDINQLTNPQTQNSYSYALNNPLVYTDPDGNEAQYYSVGFNVGIGMEVGIMIDFGFAEDGTFGMNYTTNFGGLAGLDASVNVSTTFSKARTWTETYGTGQYTNIGGKLGPGGNIQYGFADSRLESVSYGVGEGFRALPPLPFTASAGYSKTKPIFKGNKNELVRNTKTRYDNAKSKTKQTESKINKFVEKTNNGVKEKSKQYYNHSKQNLKDKYESAKQRVKKWLGF